MATSVTGIDRWSEQERARARVRSDPDFCNLAALFALHDALESLDPATAPRALVICSPSQHARVPRRRVAVLPGSFNPLHQGHVALAQAALDAGGTDEVWFGLARATVDKERVTGALLEDRLIALCHLAQAHPRYGVVLFNRGLYVEQAHAANALWPNLAALLFLVGFDKMVQILDPRYYDDREASLRDLFERAGFLVAPREAATATDLTRLLADPANRLFADRVHLLPLPAAVRGVSSTQARRELGSGATDHALDELPAAAAALVQATGAYAPLAHVGDEVIDRYAVRAALLTALFQDRSWALAHADLRKLLAVATSSLPVGCTLREALLRPAQAQQAPGRLRELLQAAQGAQ